ncbi:MAG TPA: DUF6458 family protein [Acidimicrobiales bacterium]|nr:DUF6458 family protein [Acidimicrobiales bacterium]
MGIGISVFLIAVGAIMAFAVEVENSNGFDINAIGVILMVVGAIGLVFTALIWGPRTRRTVVDDGAPAAGRRRVIEEY